MNKKKQYFITGTDTGVGKTLVTAAFLKLAAEQGMKTMGLKPVAAGCHVTSDGRRNEDAEIIARYASAKLSYEQINPVLLESAIAPHIAATQEKKCLSADRIAGYCRGAMTASHDFCLVEGAGGWRVPLNNRETMSELVKLLQLPVILVVGIRLGCLNHALLTSEAILRDGLPIAGWVANIVDANMLAMEENITTLKDTFGFPMLGQIPFHSEITPAYTSQYLDISKLLQF